MSATATNGKPARKQLADQLDRLDSVIETMGTGLNAAVAEACREGTRAAVREVLMEFISNPDLLAVVKGPVPQAAPAPDVSHAPAESPSFWGKVKSTARKARQAAAGAAQILVETVAGAVKSATDALKLTGTAKVVVGVALGVGLAAGVMCLICPSWVAAAVTGVTGAAAVVASYVGARVSSLFTSLRCA